MSLLVHEHEEWEEGRQVDGALDVLLGTCLNRVGVTLFDDQGGEAVEVFVAQAERCEDAEPENAECSE